MSAPGTISCKLVRQIADGTARLGVDVQRIYSESGISPELLDRTDARVPLNAARKAWARTAEASGDAALGMHLAEQLPFGALDVFDRFVSSATTPAAALIAGARECAALAPVGQLSVIDCGDTVRFVHRASNSIPWLSQLMLAIVVLRLRERIGPSWAPREVAMMDSELHARGALERVFGAPVAVGRPIDELVIDRAELYESAQLEDQSQLPDPDGARAADEFGRLYQAIVAAVEGGNTNIDVLAQQLGMSVRTLQRRLGRADTTHRELIEHVRSQLALRELQGRGAKQRAVAQRLGYSTPSSFHRALRRWRQT